MAERMFYSLQVVRVEGFEKKLDAPSYIKIKIDNTVHETGLIDDNGEPGWNSTFILSQLQLDTIESFRISLRQQRKAIDDHRIGQVDIKVADLVHKDEDVRICFEPESAGNLHLRLKRLSASELFDRVYKHVESAEKSAEQIMTLDDRARCTMGTVGSIIDALDGIVVVIDEIAELHSLLNLSWKSISLLYRIVSHQFKTDAKLLEMVGNMRDAFGFIENARGLKDRTEGLKPKITRLLNVTIGCARFVREYASHNFFGRLFRWRASEKIGDYAARFADYRKELDYAVALNMARGIDDIEARKVLDTLLVKTGASKLATHPRCQRNTRVKLLSDIKESLFLKIAQNMVWLTGAAGSGKSTVAMTIADMCDDMHCPAAYLFFERGKDGHVSAIRTIADRLATIHETIRPYIICAVEQNKNIVGNTVRRQFEKLLLEPLQEAAAAVDEPVIIILDALDESGSRGERKELVQLLKTEFGKLPSMVRILVTSRPEDDITKDLQTVDHVKHIGLDHHTEDSRNDVSHYIREEMMMAVDGQAPDNWTWGDIIRVLSDAADGLFIWASTAVKMVRDSFVKVDRLKDLLDNVQSVGGGIDHLYRTVLHWSEIPWGSENANYRDIFVKILGFVLFAKEALSGSDIAAFYGLQEITVNAILARLTSVLNYELGQPVRLHHASFADYLTERSGGEPWNVDELTEKKVITGRCFDTMRQKLRFNIGDIPTSFTRNVDVPGIRDRVKANIPRDLDYACRFWSDHFCEVTLSDGLLDKLHTFAYRDLLHWFEVLSLKECFTRVAAGAIRGAFTKITPSQTELSSFLWGAYKLAIVYDEPISQSVPHIYLSAISLWRGESCVADHYTTTHPVLRVHRMGNKISAMCMRILQVGSRVESIALSPDGKHVVSSCADHTIRVWDADSGALIAGPFMRHTDSISSVAYSPDGKHIVSCTCVGGLRVWDVVSGKLVVGPFGDWYTRHGHSDTISSVAFSPDGKRIVSGSYDKTIRMWDADTGALVAGPFTGHMSRIISVAFSPDGKRVVSGSSGGTIRVWDADTGALVAGPFAGHTDRVTSVAFSPDGTRVVSGSWDHTVRMRNVDTGALVVGPFTGHKDGIRSVIFSPDGKRVVSSSSDKTIRVWDADTGALVAGPFVGHTGMITSIAYSPDGKRVLSGSWDATIRVWNAESGAPVSSPFTGHTDLISSVAFSPDGKRLVSGSYDGMVRIWNVDSGEPVAGPFTGHIHRVVSVAFSPDGKRVVSASFGGTIRVWDVDTGAPAAGTFTDHTMPVLGNSVAFSPDRNRVVSGCSEEIRVWDVGTGVLVAGPFTGHSCPITSVAFSPGGDRVVSGSTDATIRVWNVHNGDLVAGPFTGHTEWITSVAFSPDGNRVVSGSGDKTIRVWNAHNGELIAGPFTGHTTGITSVAFSPDGDRVVSGSHDKTIRVWNAHNGELVVGPFTGHTGEIISVAFSPDGDRVVSSSWDKTIRVWDVSNNEGTSSASSNWELREDGWVQGAGGELLTWIPEDMRGTLWCPRNTGIFSCQFSAKLDFVNSRVGQDWWKGFPRLPKPDSQDNGGSGGEDAATASGEGNDVGSAEIGEADGEVVVVGNPLHGYGILLLLLYAYISWLFVPFL